MCLNKCPNRSVHFHPAFKVIFSLHDLQQHDQFLALKVRRNHFQNSLNSATRNRVNSKLPVRIIDVFSTAVHPTSAACVCKWASNCVLPANLKILPEKVL